jgi:NADPH:quinone reductase-like Zn-dependent oxidoreductase
MRTRNKVLLGLAAVLATAVAALAVALSRDEPCAPATAPPAGTETMRAIVRRCYGGPEVIELATLAKPVPGDEQVLVRVHAAAVNPLDHHYLHGKPYIMRLSSGLGTPTEPRLGVDYAGTVEAVGSKVTKFKPGDAVFGGRDGALGEYVLARHDRAIALKPGNVSFEQAAGAGVAAITALQALRDKGRVEAGQRVLVNGASGGVGTFAVQIAKAMGAEVTGVQSTRNLELVRSLGADHVIDYTREDFTGGDVRYDVIVDNVGNQPLLALRRVLTPGGIVVGISGPKDNPWFGPIGRSLRAALLSPFVSQTYLTLLAEFNQPDMETLADLMASGKVVPVIDREFPLAQAAEAIAYLETGRARGKVIVVVSQPEAEPAGDAPADPPAAAT